VQPRGAHLFEHAISLSTVRAAPTLIDSIFQIALLAQAPEAPKSDPGAGGLITMLPGFAIIAVLFYFLMIRPERQKQATHRALLEGLKKNDRVVTIGGIYGTVMNVQRDSDEVTLKIDEATNAKIRVTFGAIARVIADDSAGEKPA
jgi:preprotein translocase subunit YajC